MDPIDEKLRDVYDAINRKEEKVLSEIGRSEERSRVSTTEKLNALKDFISASNQAKTETILSELSRIQKSDAEAAVKCEATRASYESRLKDLEHFRIEMEKSNTSRKTEMEGFQTWKSSIDSWKEMNWQRTIIYTSIAIVAAIKLFEWLMKYFPAKPPTP